MPGDTQIMFRHAGTRGLGAGGHSTGNCLVSREGCRHMHRGLRPGGLYLEGLDAKLHYDCNNGGRVGEGLQEGSEQAALSIIIITPSLSDPSFYDKDIFFKTRFYTNSFMRATCVQHLGLR